MKRPDYINFDEMFIAIAAITSYRSKDPNTQNGCVIVDPSNRIVSVGYNGFPEGCHDDIFPWTSPEKYPYAEHSERNAIYNAGRLGIPLSGCSLYLYSERGYYPCADCARAIIQSGITMVFMASATKGEVSQSGTYSWEPTKKMFEAADVDMTVIEDSCRSLWEIATKMQYSSTVINKINIMGENDER